MPRPRRARHPCSPTDFFAGLGAQARLGTAGPLAFGLRLQGETAVQGDDISLVQAGLVVSTGTAHVRVSATPMVLGWRQRPNSFDDNGWYLGGALGASYFGDHWGVELSAGAGAPVSGQSSVMPIMSVSLLTGT